MIEIKYEICDDTLIRNTCSKDDKDRPFLCKTEPIITKEAFIKCYNEWIKKEVQNEED